MINNLPISPNKKFKYSITFQSFNEESLEAGDSLDNGYEIEQTIDLIGDILYEANTRYGIYMPVSFGTWESTEPEQDRDFFEKGISKYYALHLTNEDGTEISKEESDFISFLLSDGRYEIDKFRDYAVGGIVLGAIVLGVGALITYFYFKDKKNENGLSNNKSKSIIHTINGKDRKFPIKDAWRKEHSTENKSENHEVPQEDRFKMGGDTNSKKTFSKEDYFLVVQNWVYFTFNYPMNFVKDAFNSKHLEEKFSSSYTRFSSVGVLMSFWANLDNENRRTLSLWIKNNYFNSTSDSERTQLQSISDDNYAKIITHWNMLCFNFPHNFVEKVFEDNSEHFENKWVRSYERAGATGVVNKFFTELSSNNQHILTDWVYDNYKGMQFAGGGSIDLSTKEKGEMFTYLDSSNWTLSSFMEKFNKTEDESHDIIDSWALSRGIKKYADGGRITTNDDVINSFLTSNKQVKKGNLSTHSYEQDNQMLLRNYGTLIATREGNDVSITNTKYSKTTTIITNKVNRMALDKGMNVNLTDKFAEGGETIKDEYNILVGRIGDEYYFLDKIFKYNDGFKGATGTVVMPVSKEYFEQATSEEGILERYVDAMGEDEWISTLGLDREDFKDEDDLMKAIEDGIYQLYLNGELNYFEEVGSDLENQLRALPKFASSEEYPLFEVIGGGRVFSKDREFDEIYNQELFDKIKEIEQYAKGGKAGDKTIKTPMRKKRQPKIVRTQFEEGEYEFAKGGEAGDEIFESLYKKYRNKDYFYTNERIEIQIRNWENFVKNGDENAKKYTKEDIKIFTENVAKEEAFYTFNMIKKAIENNDKQFLKTRIRYDQKFSKDIFEHLTGEKLPNTNSEIIKFLDSKDFQIKKFADGGEISSKELNLNHQYTYEIDEDNNGSIYKEAGVYFVQGFENGKHFSETFERFKEAKDFYVSKSLKKHAKGGGIDDVTYYVAYSSYFDNNKYDIVKMKNSLKSIGATNIHTENDRGWSNQPEVVVFDFKGDGTDYEPTKALQKAFNTDWILVRVKDWKNKKHAKGGGIDDISYEKVFNVLKENIDESIDGLSNIYQQSSDFTGEEIEHKFRDGFIPYTNGGYELSWYEYVSMMDSAGYTLPTEKLKAEMQRHVDYSYELAKDTFKETYPEIVEELGEENIDYNSLYDAGYSDEAEELSNWEMENMSNEDTIRCSVIAYYYEPTNDKGEDGKHTIALQGDINLEAPYHRKGKNDDFTEVKFTFDSIKELKSKLENGLKDTINWFNGSKSTGSDDSFAKGGRLSDKATYLGKRDIESIRTVYGQTIAGKKLLDGNYVKGKLNKPKMSRVQFEEEVYEYAEGGEAKELEGEKLLHKIYNSQVDWEEKGKETGYFPYKKKSVLLEGKNTYIIRQKNTKGFFSNYNYVIYSKKGEKFNSDFDYLGSANKLVSESNYKEYPLNLSSYKGTKTISAVKKENQTGQYAEGGEIQDWMEEALVSLIEETGNDDLEITIVSDNGNEFYATDDNVEYRVFKTEDDAEEKAIEGIREDMEESPENFNQDFLVPYIDGGDFFKETLDEMNYSYAEDVASESDSKYANRLIAELVENGLMDEDDAESGNAEELADYYKDDFVSLMTDSQLDEGNNGLNYFISNFGEEETYQMVRDNNLIDIDSASRDAVNSDGIAHFLSSYDGETLYLSDDYVAYRVN